MTTPAISRNEVLYNNCTHRSIDGSGQESTVQEKYLSVLDLQVRPRSSSNPRRADGTRPPGAWNHVWRRSHAELCDVSYVDRSSWPYHRHWYVGSFPPEPGVIQRLIQDTPSSLMKQARLKALAKLKDQKVNLGVALAEARQTAELVGSAATDIANQIRRFKDRHPKDWAKRDSWKKIPPRYLEMSYGWVPLLSDVDGACEELSNLVTGRRQQPQVTAVGSAHLSDLIVHEYGGRDFLRTSQVQVKHSAYCSIVGKAPSWVLQEYSRLGLTNPLTVLWEKVPYSFVADWFLPVGSWVDTFDATNYLQFNEGSETEISRGTLVGSSLSFDRPNGQMGNVKYHVYRAPRYDAGRFVRNVLHSWPEASFPSLRAPLSLDKMAKGLALLTQIFR